MQKKVVFYLIMIFLIFQGCMRESDIQQSSNSALIGDLGQISLSCHDLEKSLSFYEKLHYSKLNVQSNANVPWALISDGSQLYMLSENEFPSPALTFYGRSLPNRINRMQAKGIDFDLIYDQEGQLKSAVLKNPADINITLINFDSKLISKPKKNPEFFLGNFDHLKIPTPDIGQSIAFWNQLGFLNPHKNKTDSGAAYLYQAGLWLDFSQDTVLQRPALVYKLESGTIESFTAKLKADDIKFENIESAGQKGIKIESPDQQAIVVFVSNPD
ncbi:MAG: hypothetical protein JSW33_16780 [bacterium]|nr:MAG: hypothetical protein JSW33_16780 [bacterium]